MSKTIDLSAKCFVQTHMGFEERKKERKKESRKKERKNKRKREEINKETNKQDIYHKEYFVSRHMQTINFHTSRYVLAGAFAVPLQVRTYKTNDLIGKLFIPAIFEEKAGILLYTLPPPAPVRPAVRPSVM